MSFIFSSEQSFVVTIEVVPPEGNDPGLLLEKLAAVSHLGFDGFSVATNPVAKPRMSAMAFSHRLWQKTKKPAILHFTVRDHNRLGLQAELWGAKALGIDTIIAVTGDPSAARKDHPCTTVNDLSVFDLIRMGRDSDMVTGAVLDFRPERNGLAAEIRRLKKKAEAGARFIVTQPVYDAKTAQALNDAMADIPVPKIMGILPLISFRHAVFLHDKVDGIAVPENLRTKMQEASDPVAKGVENAKQMMALARKLFSGACVMPPFERFDILPCIL